MVKRTKRTVASVTAKMANCRLVPARRPRKRTRRLAQRAPAMRTVDPYLHCVLGPVSQVGDGVGAPDGSIDASVTVEHRQTIVVNPVGGNLAVALVSSPYGALGMGVGVANFTANSLDLLPNPVTYVPPVSNTITFNAVTEGDGDSNYLLVPFVESLRSTGSVDDWNVGGFIATHYRTLTTQARVSYTGSTFEDNGVAATGRVTYGVDEDVRNPFTLGAHTSGNWMLRGVKLPSSPPGSFSAVAAMAGSRTFPVRESCNMINVPTNLDYQQMRDGWCPFTQTIESNTSPGRTVLWFPGCIQVLGGITNDPIPGLGHAPISFYAAAGMAATSSVTFEIRTCVEYRLQYNSPSARFARMPPIERPLAIKAVKNIARDIPSSVPTTSETEQSGWLGNALSWYGNAMKKSWGTIWGIGGDVVSAMAPGGVGKAIGGGIARTGYSLSGGRGNLAIQ